MTTPEHAQRRRRLLTAGVLILALGLAGACVTYWLETRNTDTSMEDLFPGSGDKNARQMGILYGQAWATMLGWMDALGRPAGQAGLILAGSAVAALLCFHVARLPEEDDEPQTGGNVDMR